MNDTKSDVYIDADADVRSNLSMTSIQCATMTLSTMDPTKSKSPYSNYYYGGPLAFNYMNPTNTTTNNSIYGTRQASDTSTYMNPSAFYPHPSSSYYGNGPGQITTGRPPQAWTKRANAYSSASKSKCIAPVFAALFIIFFLTTICTLIAWAVLSDGFKNVSVAKGNEQAEAVVKQLENSYSGEKNAKFTTEPVVERVKERTEVHNLLANPNQKYLNKPWNYSVNHRGHLHQIDHNIAIDTVKPETEIIRKQTNKNNPSVLPKTHPGNLGNLDTPTRLVHKFKAEVTAAPTTSTVIPWFMQTADNFLKRQFTPAPKKFESNGRNKFEPLPNSILVPHQPRVRIPQSNRPNRIHQHVHRITTEPPIQSIATYRERVTPKPRTRFFTPIYRPKRPGVIPQSMTPMYVTSSPWIYGSNNEFGKSSTAPTLKNISTERMDRRGGASFNHRVVKPVTKSFEPVPVRSIEQPVNHASHRVAVTTPFEPIPVRSIKQPVNHASHRVVEPVTTPFEPIPVRSIKQPVNHASHRVVEPVTTPFEPIPVRSIKQPVNHASHRVVEPVTAPFEPIPVRSIKQPVNHASHRVVEPVTTPFEHIPVRSIKQPVNRASHRIAEPVTTPFEPIPVRSIKQPVNHASHRHPNHRDRIYQWKPMERLPFIPITIAVPTTTMTTQRATTPSPRTTSKANTPPPQTSPKWTTTSTTTIIASSTTTPLPTAKPMRTTTALPATILAKSTPSGLPVTRTIHSTTPSTNFNELQATARSVPRQSLSIARLKAVGVPVYYPELKETLKPIANDSIPKQATMKPRLALKQPNICITPSCVDVASHINSLIDLSVDPCTDFHAYACAKILQFEIDTGPISKTDKVIKAMLESPSMETDAASVSAIKLLHAECLSQKPMDKSSIQTVKDWMAELQPGNNSWLVSPPVTNETEDINNWASVMAKVQTRIEDNGLFDIQIVHANKKPVAIISAPWFAQKNNIKESFNHLRAFAMLVGVDPMVAFAELTSVLTLEQNLYKHLEDRTKSNNSKIVDIEKFDELYPGINLPIFLDEYMNAVTDDLQILMYDEDYFKHLSSVLQNLDDSRLLIDFLLTKFAQKFTPIIVGSYLPRWKICLDYAKDFFPQIILQAYSTKLYNWSQFHAKVKNMKNHLHLDPSFTIDFGVSDAGNIRQDWRQLSQIGGPSGTFFARLESVFKDKSTSWLNPAVFNDGLVYIHELSYMVIPLLKLFEANERPSFMFHCTLGWQITSLILQHASSTADIKPLKLCSEDVPQTILNSMERDRAAFQILDKIYLSLPNKSKTVALPGLELTAQQIAYISVAEEICKKEKSQFSSTRLNTVIASDTHFQGVFSCSIPSSQRNKLKSECK